LAIRIPVLASSGGVQFIRTTLHALIAICDNCNSLPTNASDEAITTPIDAHWRSN
jgi:methylmalonyl-CoA mutase N-terminal domain/subunit